MLRWTKHPWQRNLNQIASGNPGAVHSCDSDGRQEGVSAAIIAGMDAPPVLEFSEHILDFVALAAEAFIEAGWQPPPFARRDTWRDALCF